MIEVIEKYQSLPFRYGADCCTFAAECYESQTGVNPMDGLDYTDEFTAKRLIEKHGGLESIMTKILGKPYDGCEHGDICLASNGKVELAGVIYNGEIIVRAKGGLTVWPIGKVKKVWPCRKQ